MANFKLCEKIITTALTGDDIYTSPIYHSPQQVLSALLHFIFTYGSGGTTADVYVQTSCDGGVSWCDIAQFSVAQVNFNKIVNLSALTPVSAFTPTDGSLGANTVKDGVLGSLFRVVVKSSGTYAGNTKVQVFASFKSIAVG